MITSIDFFQQLKDKLNFPDAVCSLSIELAIEKPVLLHITTQLSEREAGVLAGILHQPDKFAKSGGVMFFINYEDRGRSVSNNLSVNNVPIPPNLIPDRLTGANQQVQQNIRRSPLKKYPYI